MKPDVTFEILNKDALNQTDDQSAEQLQYGDLISFRICWRRQTTSRENTRIALQS